jgi:hypothetical protein
VGHKARYGTRIELLVLALGVDNLLVWLYESLAKIVKLIYTLASRLTEGTSVNSNICKVWLGIAVVVARPNKDCCGR